MRNRGLDSYKADDYGDSVTVHRTIKDDGSTSYKIKAAGGERPEYEKHKGVVSGWFLYTGNLYSHQCLYVRCECEVCVSCSIL